MIHLFWLICEYQHLTNHAPQVSEIHSQRRQLSWSNMLNTQPLFGKTRFIRIWKSLSSSVVKTDTYSCLTQFLPQIVWLWDGLFLKCLMIPQGSLRFHGAQFGKCSYEWYVVFFEIDNKEFALFFSHHPPLSFGSRRIKHQSASEQLRLELSWFLLIL